MKVQLHSMETGLENVRVESKDLLLQLNQSQQQVALLEAEKKAMQREIKTIREELVRGRDRAARLEEKAAGDAVSVDALREQLQNVTEKLRDSEGRATAAAKENRIHTETISRLQKKVAEKADELADATVALKTQQAVQEATNAATASSSSSSVPLTPVQEGQHLRQLRERELDIEFEVQHLKRQYEDEISSLRRKVDKLQEENAALEEAQSEMESELGGERHEQESRLEKLGATFQRSQLAWDVERQDLQDRMTNSDVARDAALGKVALLEKDLEFAKSRQKELADISKLETDRLLADIRERDRKVRRLEEEVKESESSSHHVAERLRHLTAPTVAAPPFLATILVPTALRATAVVSVAENIVGV